MKAVIFDDEHSIVEGFFKIVNWSKYGIQLVASAANGKQAREIMLTEKPDIAFVDIRMPNMNGLELIRECRKQSPNTYFVIISGYKDFQYARRAIRLGVIDYLCKPITIKMVEDVLQQIHEMVDDRTVADGAGVGIRRISIKNIRKGRPKVDSRDELSQDRLQDEVMNLVRWHDANKVHKAITFLIGYMNKNYGSGITLNGLSEIVHMNPTYLSRLFKKQTGIRYVEYLARLRMQEAKKLLNRGIKVHEVAHCVGYGYLKQFTQIFKKYCGVAPNRYRWSTLAGITHHTRENEGFAEAINRQSEK